MDRQVYGWGYFFLLAWTKIELGKTFGYKRNQADTISNQEKAI